MKQLALKGLLFSLLILIGTISFVGCQAKQSTKETTTAQTEEETTGLSETQMATIQNAVNAIDTETRAAFDTAFADWQEEWRTNSETKTSSLTTDTKGLATYTTLKEMGEGIIPLIIEKLTDEDNFIALVLYDDLQSDPLQKSIDDRDGEQGRALHTVKLWADAQAND